MPPWEGDRLKDVVRFINPDCDDLSIDSLNWVRERLTLWRVRSNATDYLVDIEATLALVNCLIKDHENQEDVSLSSEKCWDLCSQYAIVIIKFCVMLPHYKLDTESGEITRSSTAVKKSTRDLGLELQIPSWVLDCRHRICHASVNSLSLLRQASAFVRVWIYQHFWSKLELDEEDYDLDAAIRADIEALFTTPASRKRKRIFQRLEQNVRSHRREACPHIAEFLINSTFHRFKNAKINDLENSKDILIFYSHIIRVIDDFEDFEELLKSLSNFMEANNPKLVVAVEWFKIFIKTLGRGKENRQIRRCLKLPSLLKNEEDTDIICLRLLYIASRNPNRHTSELIDSITSLMSTTLPNEQISKLKKATRCFLFPFNETKINSADIKTLNDLQTLQTKDDSFENIDKIDIDLSKS